MPRSNEKKGLQSIWMDPDQALPKGWDQGLDTTRRQGIQQDRALDTKLHQAFAEAQAAADRRALSADDFARRLKSSIIKAPAGGSVLPFRYRMRDGMHRIQSRVLHGEGGLYRYAGVAALVLVAVVPFTLTRNDQQKMEEYVPASASSALKTDSDVKPVTQETTRATQSAGSGNWAAVPEGNIKPQLRSESPERRNVEPVADFDVREKELLRNLDQAKTKEAKLSALRDLERLYRDNNAPDRMRAIQLRIEEVRR